MPLQTESQYHCKYALVTTIGLMLVSVAVQFMVYVSPESSQASLISVKSDLKPLELEGVSTEAVLLKVDASVITREKQGDTVAAPEPQAVEDLMTKDGQPALSPEHSQQTADSKYASQQSAF